MHYPTEQEIVEFSANLSPQFLAELRPFDERAQREYRRVRRQQPEKYELQIDVLRRYEADVFRMLTARLLHNRPGDCDAFRRAISVDSGAAYTAYWCAHRLYNLIEGGRMLVIWCREIAVHVWMLIREAEDLWYNPDIVPKGWEDVLGAKPAPNVPDAAPAHAGATAPQKPADDPEALRERRARARQAFILPILDQKGWSRLDFAGNAGVDYKTVAGFLAGATAYANTRLKLATALGVPVRDLPE